MNENSEQKIVDYFASCGYLWQSLDGEIQQRYLNSLLPLLAGISEQIPARLAIDVGCGGGAYTQLLPQFFEKVIGCDFTERLIKEGKKKFPEVQFECTDAAHLPTSDSSTDFVMSVGLTEYLDKVEIENYFAEMARVLVPGGVCLFRVWGVYSIPWLLAKFDRGVAATSPTFYCYSRRAIRNQLERNGFENCCFVGGLLVARWGPCETILGRLLWTS
jgi:SAM-dependent methyltransferase